MIKLTLYIASDDPVASQSASYLKAFCQENTGYQLEIIDILEHPKVARTQRILAIPTLVKEAPPPMRRIIGNLEGADLKSLLQVT